MKTVLGGSIGCVVALLSGIWTANQLSPIHIGPGTPTKTPEISTFVSIAPKLSSPDMVFSVDEVRTSRSVGRDLSGGNIITGASKHRVILFTFDDGPDRRTTPRLLRYLDEAKVKGVFFVTTNKVSGLGDRVRAQTELLREIVRRGHFVGNHTHEHSQLPLLSTVQAAFEIETSERIIESIVGQRPWLFRPPGGARSPRIDRLLHERGYTQILWNLGTGDFQVRTAEEVVETWLRILDRQEREEGNVGGIVLLHDTHPWSIEAFPRMVAELRHRNCQLLEQNEELYDIIDDPLLFFDGQGNKQFQITPPLELPTHILEARQVRVREEARQRCYQTVAQR